MPEKNRPPKTVAEVGVHLFYMAQNLEAISKKLDGYPSRAEVNELRSDFEKHIDNVKSEFVPRSELQGILKLWEAITSKLGVLLVGSMLAVLIFVTAETIKEVLPEFVKGKETVAK